ncbi:hydroxymethylpyrimidine/phosphomethylpyrimidine kinase [Candidatus Acidulodesulfobacterium sp. H_13]|uniref:hydroxymethylpyrimidine/phosphomethylpyrimidine kinase n=1 Tax=Candidatus Acidulodesulfobacterium sp. H_13 TaxID=3395470 RepID=UPI003AF64395
MASIKTVKALSVAGFDGSGGAGITSDAKIFSRFKIFGLSAITVMTAQNPDNIYLAEPVSDAFFLSELNAIFDYFVIDVVKIGLIFNERQGLILSKFLNKYKPKTIIVDPVYISTSNKVLTGESAYPDFLMPLFRYATVITPNICEAELIAGMDIKDIEGMKTAARVIRKKIPEIENIIIKGSHLSKKSDRNKIFDIVLNSKNEFFICSGNRLELKKEIHGTGCAFSACLASQLANGVEIKEALNYTEKFVNKIIRELSKIPDNDSEKDIYITGNI